MARLIDTTKTCQQKTSGAPGGSTCGNNCANFQRPRLQLCTCMPAADLQTRGHTATHELRSQQWSGNSEQHRREARASPDSPGIRGCNARGLASPVHGRALPSPRLGRLKAARPALATQPEAGVPCAPRLKGLPAGVALGDDGGGLERRLGCLRGEEVDALALGRLVPGQG